MTLDALTRTACEAMLATVLWKQYQGSADRMCYLAGLLQQSRFNDSSSISSHQRCMKWRVSGSLHSTSTAYSRSLGPLTAPAVVWTGCTGGTPAIIIQTIVGMRVVFFYAPHAPLAPFAPRATLWPPTNHLQTIRPISEKKVSLLGHFTTGVSEFKEVFLEIKIQD